MERPDNFNEVAAALLFTDVELGLTFVRIALSRPEGALRNAVIERAETAYRQISELETLVPMTDASRTELREKLGTLQTALLRARADAHNALSPS